MVRKLTILISTMLSLAVLYGTASFAELERVLTLEEKIAAAGIIVHARCINTNTEWRNGLIVTTAEYLVIEDMRNSGNTQLNLVVPGGTALHPTLGVAVTTRLSNGVDVSVDDEVILFAVDDAQSEKRLIAGQQAYVRVTKDSQGIARVRTDKRRVVAKPADNSSTQTDLDGATDVSFDEYSVEEFKERLRAGIATDRPGEKLP